MELPVYIDGKREGTLTMERQGAATVIRADIRDVGRVVRLRLYGDGEGYLGIPVPENGRQVLTKRLTALEMRRLPSSPTYAAESPMRGEARRAAPEPSRRPEHGETAPERKTHVVWRGGKPYYF